jgi:hypothetical protein
MKCTVEGDCATIGCYARLALVAGCGTADAVVIMVNKDDPIYDPIGNDVYDIQPTDGEPGDRLF